MVSLSLSIQRALSIAKTRHRRTTMQLQTKVIILSMHDTILRAQVNNNTKNPTRTMVLIIIQTAKDTPPNQLITIIRVNKSSIILPKTPHNNKTRGMVLTINKTSTKIHKITKMTDKITSSPNKDRTISKTPTLTKTKEVTNSNLVTRIFRLKTPTIVRTKISSTRLRLLTTWPTHPHLFNLH